MTDEFHLRGVSGKNYDHFHRTIEVQVFPQNLRATWDDTGCCICIFAVLLLAMFGMFASGLHFHWTQTNEAVIDASETWALFTETGMLICLLFCSCIVVGFIGMCLCGVNTQVMAARKRNFGSLRKNRVLLSLMRGQSAWDEPDFQRRLRQQDRRLDRVRDTVEARMESWLTQREARVRYMQSMRYQLAKVRTRRQLEADKPAGCCVIL